MTDASDEAYLASNCESCGQPLSLHVCREQDGLIDILPCVEMLRGYGGGAKWEEATEFDNCRKCGKPMIDHLVFERPGVKVMGKTLWMRKPRVMILFPCAVIPCHLVTPGEPLLGRVPPPRDETLTDRGASEPAKPAHKNRIRAILDPGTDPLSPSRPDE